MIRAEGSSFSRMRVVRGTFEKCGERLFRRSANPQGFGSAGYPVNDLYPRFREAKLFREQSDDRGVGLSLFGGGGDAEFQHPGVLADDPVCRGFRLNLDRKKQVFA